MEPEVINARMNVVKINILALITNALINVLVKKILLMASNVKLIVIIIIKKKMGSLAMMNLDIILFMSVL